MATEEELRDAQILKTNAEAELAREQLREHQRSTHIVRRIGQGIGVGVVLALAGMALFGPIKDTIEAESKLAALNAKIAERTNEDLQQRLSEREEQLNAQEQRYTDDLAQFAEDLRKANEARDAAIQRSEELSEREKDLAEKFGRLAAQLQDNDELVLQAEAAKDRAKQLEIEIASLQAEAQAGEAIAANVQTRVNVRPLRGYAISVDTDGSLAGPVEKRLNELGLTYEDGTCRGPGGSRDPKRVIGYYNEDDKQAANLLADALNEVMPGAKVELVDVLGRDRWLWICPY